MDDWWHQMDTEMQEREELERIDACNAALPYPWCAYPEECSKTHRCAKDPNCGE